MKKILLVLSLLLLLGLEAGSFTFFYLKLDKIQEKIVYLEKVVEELPEPMDPKNVGDNQPIQPGEVMQPGSNPLANHDTFIAYGDDADSIVPSAEPIFEGASVPEVVQLDNGDLLLYFVDAETLTSGGTEQIGYSKSTDGGVTWSEKDHVVFSGKLNQGPAVDPSLVELLDGTLRMYFYGPDGPITDVGSDTSEHNVYSAVSEDGISFAVEEGARFSAEKLTDPEVIWHQGRWLMYYSLGTTTGIATSNDGLAWSDTEFDWSGGGVPGAYVDGDDVVHLYGCNPQGLLTAASVDGVEFTEEPVQAFSETIMGVCDPSPVLLDDGSMIMVYKQIAKE